MRAYTKLRIEPEYWSSRDNRCLVDEVHMSKRVLNKVRIINDKLDEMARKLEYADHQCAEKGLFLSKEGISAVVAKPEASCRRESRGSAIATMRQIAGNYSQHLNSRGGVCKANTCRTYLAAIDRLEQYLVASHRKRVEFGDFDKNFLTGFAEWLTKHPSRQGRAEKSYSALTVTGTLRIIINILRKAYDRGLSDSQCGTISEGFLRNDVPDKIYLDENELAQIARVRVNNATERAVRDLFVIAAYTGLRMSDVNRLGTAIFAGDEFTIVQAKTGNPVHVPILKEVAELIGTYRRTSFPKVSSGVANKCIRMLADRAGINESILVSETRGGVKTYRSVNKCSQVSFHTARRSCITNLFKRGYSPNFIMSLSGHKSIASFERYIKSSSEEISQAFIKELRNRKDIGVPGPRRSLGRT